MNTKRRAAAALFLVAALTAPARAEAPPRTFVGELVGGPRSARIALVVHGDDVTAYACSQDDEFNKAHSQWFQGKLKDGAVEASEAGNTLKARPKGDSVEGTLTGTDRKELSFVAARAKGVAGLYRGEDRFGDEDFVAGWIVDQRHDVVGSCRGRKRNLVRVLKIVRKLPPPPQDTETVTAEQQVVVEQQAQEALQAQVDPAAETVVQAEQVKSLKVPLPKGKKLPVKK